MPGGPDGSTTSLCFPPRKGAHHRGARSKDARAFSDIVHGNLPALFSTRTQGGDGMKSFDMSLVQCGARLRRSPFYEAEQRYGPLGYTVYNHTMFPIQYDDLETEYWHLLNHVTVWDVAVERQVEITGPDAFRLTQMLTPRDLATCEVGQGKYVLITAPDGGIVNDPVLMRLKK